MGQQVERDERSRRGLGQLPDALLGGVDALGQRVEVEARRAGDHDLAVEDAARRELAHQRARPVRESSASAASRSGCPARRRRRPERRCSGTRPTWARRTARPPRQLPGRLGQHGRHRRPTGSSCRRPPCSAVQATSSSAVPRLTTRSKGTAGRNGVATAPAQPLELARSVGVGVDGERAPEVDGLAQEVLGRVLALGSRVDLDRRPGPGAGGEHGLGVEGDCGRPRPVMRRPVQWPEDVGVRALDRRQHAAVICRSVHAQFRVHAGDHHVELARSSTSRSSEPSSRMSTSMPVRMRNGASCSFSPASTSSCSRSRSSFRPWATVRRAL